MKILPEMTLSSVLEHPLFADVAADAIKAMDLTQNEIYPKTLGQLRAEGFGGDVMRGLQRLADAAEAGAYCFHVYSEEACAAQPDCKDTHIVWFPSDVPGADDRPYVLVVPGGGFENVWNLTEGWPVADHFNKRGYHAFVLTYQVGEGHGVIPREMEDFAAAIRFIRAHEKRFHVQGDRYITCGFSAGGYLVSLWSTNQFGSASFSLPKPQAMFPVYPFVSWKLSFETEGFTPEVCEYLNCSVDEAINSAYEIPEHVEDFPPCAIFLAAQDGLVPPEHSKMLARALDAAGIPCRLEIGPEGGHGFADATGMCMAGWPERAIDWYESLQKA